MTTMANRLRGAEQAASAAQASAEKAGITIRDLVDLDEISGASLLFDEVWSVTNSPSILPTNLARAMSHAGSYFAAAFQGDEMVGAIIGFVGFSHGIHLHSHVLGVLPNAERGGIGFALKQHQRAWALNHGLDTVSWTFDPLVRRNAYFNLCKLGAELSDYHVEFYGEMNDGLNAGDESDRAVVRWRLNSKRAVAASQHELEEPDIEALRSAGAAVVLDESSGIPMPTGDQGDMLLCRIPSDIVALRRADPDLALSWRKALRDSLGVAISEGYLATGISKSGWYVLERPGTST
jgi:predicted GNAT superfamily acetyltransferase